MILVARQAERLATTFPRSGDHRGTRRADASILRAMTLRCPIWLVVVLGAACAQPEVPHVAASPTPASPPAMANPIPSPTPSSRTELATLGGGCFWCIEAGLEVLDGVTDVTSGYAGGAVDNPTYHQVCEGETGHAEVVQVTFDPQRISYAKLLEWFFKMHDPTTLNRQGPDEGTQYRSAIFFHSEEQKKQALAVIAKLQPGFRSQIVTEVAPLTHFWPAETYHQDYFRNNPNAGYCRIQIAPKLHKLGLDGEKK
jgi:peptide-methionine (S)-S-oxide reductase